LGGLVPSKVFAHELTGNAFLNLNLPTGGCAYGIPRKYKIGEAVFGLLT